jgi:hypothetical protein
MVPLLLKLRRRFLCENLALNYVFIQCSMRCVLPLIMVIAAHGNGIPCQQTESYLPHRHSQLSVSGGGVNPYMKKPAAINGPIS